jgi:hypothetical protein
VIELLGGNFLTHQGCKPYPITPYLNAPQLEETRCEKKCRPNYTQSYEEDKVKGINYRDIDNGEFFKVFLSDFYLRYRQNNGRSTAKWAYSRRASIL